MHRYRTHTCGALRESDIGAEVRLSGWCHRIRDHGGVLFIDLRDHYGITQVVADPDSAAFKTAETLRSEWVVRVDGKVRRSNTASWICAASTCTTTSSNAAKSSIPFAGA